jgi:pimeloyl-ACP methyl ester carboxylesterase
VQGVEFQLDTRQGRVAGLGWRNEGAPRVLCLHGWLDNAASFVPLAPFLDTLDLVAIDLPGHGRSGHRDPTARYHFIDYLFNLDAALDELGWPDCHLLGHSMGAAICAVFASGAPERVRSLVLLDTVGPISVTAEGTALRLRRSLEKNRRGTGAVRQFDSIEEMVQARRKVSDLSEPAARLICERGARSEDGRFAWRSDPALNWVSALVMTDEQALDILRNIEAPALTLTVTEESPWCSADKLAARKQAMARARHLTLQGHHHFHMDAPGQIAETVRNFIIDNDRPAAKRTS